jgi:hypothetical protein
MFRGSSTVRSIGRPSRRQLDAELASDLHGDLGHCQAGTVGSRSDVEDDRRDGVRPQPRLPAAGVARQVGMQPSTQTRRGVDGVLGPPAHRAAVEQKVAQVALRQALVLQPLAARWAGKPPGPQRPPRAARRPA